jgi:hypothetical protein
MGGRRRVRCSEQLVRHARSEFPPGGAADGTPAFEHFAAGPLAAATEFFMRQFDEAPEAAAGIRVWVTIKVPLFAPMAFYAAEVGDHVELLDYSSEDAADYWELYGDDPA